MVFPKTAPKKLIFILIFNILFVLCGSVFATTTITFENEFGLKNFILLAYLIFLLLFWVFIFYKFTTPLNFNKTQMVKSISNFFIKTICFVWFVSILITSQAVLLSSNYDSYLTDKLDLLFPTIYLTVTIFLFIGIINLFKLYNNMTGIVKFFKEFVYEIKKGGGK